jgi:predicted sulfurtransferase
MARKLAAKKTHHCWCGTTGNCRKHFSRCDKHNIDYYSSGRCSGCKGEAAAADRKEYREKQDRKKDEENQKKKNRDDWYNHKQ